MESLGLDWEWIVVDDHSSDDTFAVINRLAERDRRVRGVRFARNFGAHTARDLRAASGTRAIASPRWRRTCRTRPRCSRSCSSSGGRASRSCGRRAERREGERAATLGFSRLYYWVMRSIVGIKEMPATGADFFLIDRAVVDAFSRFSESNVEHSRADHLDGLPPGHHHLRQGARGSTVDRRGRSRRS